MEIRESVFTEGGALVVECVYPALTHPTIDVSRVTDSGQQTLATFPPSRPAQLSDTSRYTATADTRAGLTSLRLTVTSATCDDAGLYTCSVQGGNSATQRYGLDGTFTFMYVLEVISSVLHSSL